MKKGGNCCWPFVKCWTFINNNTGWKIPLLQQWLGYMAIGIASSIGASLDTSIVSRQLQTNKHHSCKSRKKATKIEMIMRQIRKSGKIKKLKVMKQMLSTEIKISMKKYSSASFWEINYQRLTHFIVEILMKLRSISFVRIKENIADLEVKTIQTFKVDIKVFKIWCLSIWTEFFGFYEVK